jgi:putative membrane protein
MSVLTIVGVVAAGIAAALHVGFFLLESVFFARPSVRRLFGVRSADDSSALRLFARNQGVYNLGLALVVSVGIALLVGASEYRGTGQDAVGTAVIVAGCAVMALAALALVATAPRLWLAALVQGVPPLMAAAALFAR